MKEKKKILTNKQRKIAKKKFLKTVNNRKTPQEIVKELFSCMVITK